MFCGVGYRIILISIVDRRMNLRLETIGHESDFKNLPILCPSRRPFATSSGLVDFASNIRIIMSRHSK